MTATFTQKLNSLALTMIVVGTLFYGAVGPEQPSVIALASNAITAVQFA